MFRTYKTWTIGSMLILTTVGHAASNYIQGHVGGLSNQGHSGVGDVPGNKYNLDFEFDYQHNIDTLKKAEFERRFTVAAMVNDESLTMYSLKEAYIGGNLTSKDHFRFGRQILPWSEVDSVWGFGKLNNRRNFDYFTPDQEGLVGLLYERRSSNGMRYRFFASGLYVPEMNPSQDIDKDKKTITTRHAWGEAPSTTAVIEGSKYDIEYDVNYPDISDVIYRYTVAANIGYESKHWNWDNFVVRKPENTLTPDVGIAVDFASKIVSANITPKFYYHDVFGSTLKYKNHDIEMYLSGIGIRPNEYPDVSDENVIRQMKIKNKKRREDYIGGGISRSNDLYTIAFNYVARLSPFDRDADDLSADPRWNQAIHLHGKRNFGKKWSLMGDVKFDMLTTDRLVMLRADYMATKKLMLNAGLQMIGTPTDGKSYWSPFTNNDSIYGGLRYVF